MIAIAAKKKAGVIAWPGKYSLSPKLHGYWLKKYDIDGTYEIIATPPSNLEKTLKELPENGYSGVNITIPHKELARAFIEETDDVVDQTGAINTVVVKENGALFGTNTDVFGFLENLRLTIKDWNAQTGPAVVLGAGGAARAVCLALLSEGVPLIKLSNRSQERAENLKKVFGDKILVYPWGAKERILENSSLLVNTTSLGMEGMENLDFNLTNLPQTSIVYDIVYNQKETNLLRNAREQGYSIVNGLGMLLHQGRAGFQAWFGVEPKVTRQLYNYMEKGL